MVTSEVIDHRLIIHLSDRVDSANANEIEKQINLCRSANPGMHITLDLAELAYISSAGLRIVLKLRKEDEELKIVHVSPDVYDVFEMTGFTEMIPVEKQESN